jgi:hypothetical protein
MLCCQKCICTKADQQAFNTRICQNKILIYTVKKHVTQKICQRKFGGVKGALFSIWDGSFKQTQQQIIVV